MRRPLEGNDWASVTDTFRRAFRSSFHLSVGTVDADGAPHVTPIGSVLLGELGRGIYFDVFAAGLRHRLVPGAPVCVSAVDSGLALWVPAMLAARFAKPPGVRLFGNVVGNPRRPTDAEIARWRRRVRALRLTRGHAMLWGRLETVRDFEFHSLEWVTLGRLTAPERRS